MDNGMNLILKELIEYSLMNSKRINIFYFLNGCYSFMKNPGYVVQVREPTKARC
jgi:hypothetical protein